MKIDSLFKTLPAVIDRIGYDDFYRQVDRSFRSVSSVSHFKILVYSKQNHPRLLAGKRETELDQDYCESAYLLDPFYDVICRHSHNGLVTLDSITRNDFEHSAYYNQFYNRLGWNNETNYIIHTPQDHTICLVYTTEQSPNALNHELIPYLESIKSAIFKHEEWHELGKKSYGEHDEKSHSYWHCSHGSAAPNSYPTLFGLTRRESEIVEYILQGHSTSSIAKMCFVSQGTVKNHRKNIYRKLNIKSQCELFSKFMN